MWDSLRGAAPRAMLRRMSSAALVRPLVLALGLVVCGGISVSREAAAEPASPAAPDLAILLPKLGQHAARLEEMKKRGSFTLSGRMEEVDGSGQASSTKEVLLRSIARPGTRTTEILRYTEDGADKTSEARAKAEKRRAEGKKEKRRDVHLPFLASEQARYVFGIAERDANKPTRMRVTFTPKESAEDAFKGSAWVDEPTGEVLTLGFSPTKTSMFVDQVDVTMRFDLATPLGRAPSTISFEARGGVLFFRKRVRGSGTISDPSLAF
jgi:hypothetical protein